MGMPIPVLVETVKVKREGHPDRFVEIAKADFNPNVDELWSDGDAEQAELEDSQKPPVATEKPGFKLEDVVRKDTAEALVAAGFGTALAIHAATLEQLTEVKGVGARVAEQLKAEAAEFVEEPPAP